MTSLERTGPEGSTTVDAEPSRRVPQWLRRVPRFLAVGATATAFYGLLYLVLRELMTPQWANIVALVASTLLSTGGNRRVTFHSTAAATIVPHHTLGLGLVVAGLGITSGALGLLGLVDPDAGRLTEVLVLGVANGLVGTLRFVSFSLVMHEDPAPAPEPQPDDDRVPAGL